MRLRLYTFPVSILGHILKTNYRIKTAKDTIERILLEFISKVMTAYLGFGVEGYIMALEAMKKFLENENR